MFGFSFKTLVKKVLRKPLLVYWIHRNNHSKSTLQLAGHEIYLELHNIWFHLYILKYGIML